MNATEVASLRDCARLALALCCALIFPITMVGCHSAPAVEVVATLNDPPGNLTVTPTGRIIVSMHQHFAPELRVGEVIGRTRIKAFPNAAWNNQTRPADQRLDTVLGVQCDPTGIVWMLDNGMRGGVQPKLVGWDTNRDALHRVIPLPPPVTRDNSFVNDLAVDAVSITIYIADPAGGDNAALILVDVASGRAVRVLEGHASVIPEDIDLLIDGKPAEVCRPDGSIARPRIGVNPIALDHENRWLYYSAMHSTSVYRIPTALLRARVMTSAHSNGQDRAHLAASIERVADKPISDGSSMDRAGLMYITDIGNNAIGVSDTNTSEYRVLYRDDEILSWPDAFAFGPDGWMYCVAAQLHKGPVLNAGVDASTRPFYIVRFRPEAPGVVGR